jgi:hypothetical protein
MGQSEEEDVWRELSILRSLDMAFDPKKPFNDLPLLPPIIFDVETKAVLKKTIAAGRALAKLKSVGGKG